MNPERLSVRWAGEAKPYERRKNLLELAGLGLQAAFLILLTVSGLSFFLKEWAAAGSARYEGQVALYYLLFFILLAAVEFPLTIYSGFFLEKRYQLTNHRLGTWLVDYLKRALLALLITLPLVVGLYALIKISPGRWWFWAWLGYTAFTFVLGQLFPVLIVPLFYRYGRVEDEGLKQRIFRLVERYQLPLENVYSLNLSRTTKKANAMFAGIGKTKRLVLADTLIEKFTPEEIESVVAHELGHYKNRDLLRSFIFQAVTSCLGFAAAFQVFRFVTATGIYSGQEDLAAFPLLYLLSFVLTLLGVPLANAYSRRREALADKFSLEACGKAGFIPAMEKLAELNLADPDPHPAVEWWFYSHPPIKKRIGMAKAFSIALFLAASLGVPPPLGAAEKTSEQETARKAVEQRSRTEMMKYFMGKPGAAEGPNVSVAIDLYNQAVEFYEQSEFQLSREALVDSLRYDDKNPFAHELLGEIEYYEENLEEALKHYKRAYQFQARQDLKEKILKVEQEKNFGKGLKTIREEHFLIRYRGEEKGGEGYELSETLNQAYHDIGTDLGYFFKHRITVLLYDAREFRDLMKVPHWTIGAYDGKIRLPAYQKGFTDEEIRKVIRHETTHAFVAEISRRQCPAWLNEGLAEFEETRISPSDLSVFWAAVKVEALFPIETLFNQKKFSQMEDPLEVELFYRQSQMLVSYLVWKFGMFEIKRMLEAFGQGGDSFDVVQEVLKITPQQLEKQWKESLPKD